MNANDVKMLAECLSGYGMNNRESEIAKAFKCAMRDMKDECFIN